MEDLYDLRQKEGWKNTRPLFVSKKECCLAFLINKDKSELSVIEIQTNKEIFHLNFDTICSEFTEEPESSKVSIHEDLSLSETSEDAIAAGGGVTHVGETTVGALLGSTINHHS